MDTVRIYYTSDTHGNLIPVNYTGGGEKRGGLLCIAREIEKDGNTLVLDGGDSLQGTPLISYYLEHAEQFSSHPAADSFAAMGLDAFTLGNHDFNFGYGPLSAYVHALTEKGAVCVCANVTDLTGQLPIRPFTVFTLENGLSVGVSGVVTDYVNVWEKPEHLASLRVGDALEAAAAALEAMRPLCDLAVCIYHGGYERDLATGALLSESIENRACLMGESLDYDVLLTGHQHMAVREARFGRTFSVQPPDGAGLYVHLEGRKQKASGWEFSSELVQAGTDWDREGRDELLTLEEKTQHWLDQKIGRLAQAIPPEGKLEAALHGSRVAALINQIQLEAIPADFSCTSLQNDPVGFEERVSIRDIYRAYPFANVNMVKQVTGRVLRLALERCASYLELEDGKPVISDRFLKPKIEHYNYDFYAGLDYAFDLRRPVGERVVRLRRLDGTPVEEEKTYTLVCSDYRASGTGGYEMIGECPVVYTSADNTQDLLIAYIRSHDMIRPADNFRFRAIWSD